MLPVYIFQFGKGRNRKVSILTENDGRIYPVTQEFRFQRIELDSNGKKVVKGRYKNTDQLYDNFGMETELPLGHFMLSLEFE